MSQVRVRVAPSPTGKLHIGTARTALFNFLYAKHNKGVMVLRIEDTDPQRSTKENQNDIESGLEWLKIIPDEGPLQGGEYGPYLQSERLDRYDAAAKKLILAHKAYPCFCTPEELEVERRKAQDNNAAFVYPGTCRHLTPEEVAQRKASGKSSVLRFLVPHEQTIHFVDLVKGRVEFNSSLIGDFVIQRADGMPLYTLANVVDDSAMQITHILRGEDLLPSTPNQIMLYEALGEVLPQFGHLPLLLNPDRSKLSKRKGATSVNEFKAEGYLPEALVNFIAFLGWSPGTEEEIFSLAQLEEVFTLERVQKAGAIFDERRLRFLNAHYLKKMDDAELLRRFKEWRELVGAETLAGWEKDYERLRRAIPIAKERAETLADLTEPFSLFIEPAEAYTTEVLIASSPQFAERTPTERTSLFEKLLSDLSKEVFEPKALARWIDQFLESEQLNKPELLAPMRIALTGRKQSPGVAEMLYVFGKEESLKRLQTALDKLKS